MNVLVIIPTFNERENIEDAVCGALAADSRISVLVVDDGSPDGTGAIADELAAMLPGRVSVLHRPRKSGLGSAYLEGFASGLARGFEVICEMDADGSHDPMDLPRLLEALVSADVALGSRRVRGGKVIGWGFHRHAMSTGAMSVARFVLGLKTRDVTAGFRCYRRAVVEKLLTLPIRSDGYAFQEETLYYCERLGFRVAEVPVTFRDRTKGESKMSLAEAVGFFRTVARLRAGSAFRRRYADDRSQSVEDDDAVVARERVGVLDEEPVE